MTEKTNIKKSELKKMYLSMSNKDLCEKLGVTLPTLMKYLKLAGIKKKGSGNRTNTKAKIKIID